MIFLLIPTRISGCFVMVASTWRYLDEEFFKKNLTPLALHPLAPYPGSRPYTAHCKLQSVSILTFLLEKVQTGS